jgi:hypothetical protein
MRVRGRRGMALVAALTLITLLGVVVAALVASSVTAQRAIRLGQSGATALASAEYGASSIIADPAGYQLASLPLGVTRRFVIGVTQTSAVQVDVGVTRLPRGVVWMVADAAVAGIDSSERRVNLIARFPDVAPLPAAAIESRGDVSLASDVTIGTDTTGEADCAARSDAPNVVTAPGASVSAPPAVRSVTGAIAADSNSYLLTGHQRSILATNVGVAHVAGDTTIAGGSFDGILLVDGALTITGPLVVTGLVVASGPVRVSGGRLSVTGALLSAYAGPGRALDLNATILKFAPCVVAFRLRAATRPQRVRERAWSEVF